MATIVVEAFVSVSVEVLLKKIASGEFLDFFRSTKLDDSLLSKLNITLLCLQSLLIDAGEREIKNDAVKQWLVLLQDAVFEAEDLFDEINTEALRWKVKARKSAKAKVWKFLSTSFNHWAINSKMHTLYDKLDHFANRGQLLGLKEGVSSNNVWLGTPTSSVVDASSIFGRVGDIEKLKIFLRAEDDSCDDNKIGVISIVGMGGLGKTTLAKLLYNDPEVKTRFDIKGWASISKDFDVVRITKTILESITNLKTIDKDSLKSGDLLNSLNALQVQLQQRLSNKKFLLVLDDIWFGNYLNWNNLKDIFNVGKNGSKVIVTTRDKRVAQNMQTFLPIYDLEPLKSEDCWFILAKHAFGAATSNQRSILEVTGKEIADKCRGLPLAAAALGGLLRINLSQDYWSGVLKSSIWESIVGEVQPALLLSYRFLPTSLKGCFAYCSIFPKNSILKKRKVVQLWMADGLVLQPRIEKGWEKLGEEYFDELVSRSLIHQRFDDGKECFEMHDLMNDLATLVSSPYCLRLDEQKRDESIGMVYVPFCPCHYKTLGLYNIIYKIRYYVTCYHLQGKLTISQLENVSDPSHAFQANLKTKDQIDKLVLKWSVTNFSYLQIQHLVLEQLRPSTNLKKLVIEGFDGKKFPKWLGESSSFGNMVYLKIWCCNNCSWLPPLGQLGNLKELYVYWMESIKSVGAEFFGSGSGPSYQPFPSLETLSFEDMPNLEEWECELIGFGGTMTKMFPSLRCLSLERCPKLVKGNNILKLAECPLLVECGKLMLPPPFNSLRNLSIRYFSSLTSVGDGLPKTLQSLKIWGCENLEFLPHESLHNYTSLEDLMIYHSCNSLTSFTLGSLPVLKSLNIRGCKNLKSILITEEDVLQKSLSFIRSIKIQECNELESFHHMGRGDGFSIPNLILFQVNDCKKLRSLPQPMKTLSGLQEMVIQCVPNLEQIIIDHLPISLWKLHIHIAGGISWNTTWEHLTCLSNLIIEGDAVKALMKAEVPLLPSSLVLLCITNLNDIECLDGKWLQHLTSLNELFISKAPNLKSLPEEGLLPSSLFVLKIYDCPLLEASLQRMRGKEWRKISHIPFIQLNCQMTI